MTYGATGDDVSNDSNGATGDNDDVDGDGAMGNYVDNDGSGVMSDNVDGDGVMGYDDDYGNGTTGDNVDDADGNGATGYDDESTTLMATLGWEHGRCRHQAYPLPGRLGDDGGIAMMMAGGGLGLGFGGDSS